MTLTLSSLRPAYWNGPELNARFAGGLHLILGPNGVGKSTLLRTLAELQPPASGTLEKAVSTRIGLLPQTCSFGGYLSVEEYLTAPVKFLQVPKEAVAKAAVAWKISDFMARSPHTLSGGEQQRVHLCRFLAMNRDVYLLDEPYAALDYRFQGTLRAAIHDLHTADKVVLLVHHSAGGVLLQGAQWIHFLSATGFQSVSARDSQSILQAARHCFGVDFEFNAGWLVPQLTANK